MRKLKDIYTDEKRCDRRQLYSARCHIFFLVVPISNYLFIANNFHSLLSAAFAVLCDDLA